MSPQDLTRLVKDFVRSQGADLVGVAPVERYMHAPEKLRPQAHMPEARAVLVMAIHHPDATVNFGAEPNSNFTGGWQTGMIAKLDTLSLRAAKFLERQGYRAVPYSCTFFWRHRKGPECDFDHAASFSHMNAFVAAGLGEYGWHGMAMSPEYGPRQRIVSVFTDAPLVADDLYSGEALCDHCRQCEKACWGSNYQPSTLLNPPTVKFEIGDKKIEYANINRWRCFWGEQCHLDVTYLKRYPELDEQKIYQAIADNIPRSHGMGGYMCSSFKYCMSKPIRKWDRKMAPNPLRRKAAPVLSDTKLPEHLIALARRAGADRIGILPLPQIAKEAALRMYPGYRKEDFLRIFKYVITFGKRLPGYAGKTDALSLKNYDVTRWNTPLNILNTGRMMIASTDIARFLDDAGYEAGQDGGFLFEISTLAARKLGWTELFSLQSVFTDAPLVTGVWSLKSVGKIAAPDELLSRRAELFPNIELTGAVALSKLAPEDQAALKKVLPSAKSLVAVAAAIPARVTELAGRQPANCAVSYQFATYQTLREAFWAAQDMAGALQEINYRAEPLFEVDVASAGREFGYIGSAPDLRGEARFAAAANLGFVGRHGLLITPQFGSNQRLAFVLTDAEFAESIPTGGKCPDDCRQCLDACPMSALSKRDGKEVFARDENRCSWARVWGLNEREGTSLGGFRSPDLPFPKSYDETALVAALAQKDPLARIGYESDCHGDTPVERCLQACPLNHTKSCNSCS